MTGMPQHEPEQQDGRSQPPLPGPVEEVEGPMTIIPGPPAQDSPTWTPTHPAPAQTHAPGTAYPAQVPATTGSAGTTLSGFFSAIKRTGRWEVPATLTVVGGFAETVLDLREAVITSPVVEIKVYDAFASCKIIVPPGVGVDMGGGMSLFADESGDYQGVADPGMYRLRILHYGAFSEVKVVTLAPGEAEPKWWKRLM